MLVSSRKAQRRPPEVPGKPRRSRRPRAKRSADADAADPARLGPPQLQEWPDGDWVVRQVPGAAAAKLYRCPGCDQEIPAGTAHVVVWPAAGAGPQARRHWHASCWQRRPRRPAWPR